MPSVSRLLLPRQVGPRIAQGIGQADAARSVQRRPAHGDACALFSARPRSALIRSTLRVSGSGEVCGSW